MNLDQLLAEADGDLKRAMRRLARLARASEQAPSDPTSLSTPELASLLRSLLELYPGDRRGGHGNATVLEDSLATLVGQPPLAALRSHRVSPVTIADSIARILEDDPVQLAPTHDRYDGGALLGAGGMGEVRQVTDRRLQRAVAMKRLHRDVIGVGSAKQFETEAQITARLDHPNIVPVYDLDQSARDGLYFTMKQVVGRSLAQAIDEAHDAVAEGREDYALAVLRLVQDLRPVCDAIAYAHDQGFAHRDLKPHNVMLGAYGEVLVMDWGIACPKGSPVTAAAGTPAYMAPELLQEQAATVQPAADIYALGATLYHVLTLQPPAFDSPPPSTLVSWPVPPELEAVAMRAMSARPAQRYASVAALGDDIKAWLEGRPLASLSYGLSTLARKWVGRNRPVVAGVSLTLAVAVVGAAFGAVRYVWDINAARDAAQVERDRAQVAETETRRQLAESQLAEARQLTQTHAHTDAHALYRTARASLVSLDQPLYGADLNGWDNLEQASPVMFSLTLPQPPAELVIEASNGWLVSLEEGKPVVARSVPLFERVWTSNGNLPACEDRAVRWEVDTLALYCARASGQFVRVDLGTNVEQEIIRLEGGPLHVEAPAGSLLVFAGVGHRHEAVTAPVRRWWALTLEPDGAWRTLHIHDADLIRTAHGDWVVDSRYDDPGTRLTQVERGLERLIHRPLAKVGFSGDGERMAVYRDVAHRLSVEPTEGGAPLLDMEPDQALNVLTFARDPRLLFVSGTIAGIEAIDVASGAIRHRFLGHGAVVRHLVVNGNLLLSRTSSPIDAPANPRHDFHQLTEQGRVVNGYALEAPPWRAAPALEAVLPPGEVGVLWEPDDRSIRFVDLATGRTLRQVSVPMLEAKGLAEGNAAPREDGVLLVTPAQLVWVPLVEGPAVEVLRVDPDLPREVEHRARGIGQAERLDDGTLALCKGNEVLLLPPGGEAVVLGHIPGSYCRDLRAVSADAVYVTDFRDHTVHRFGQGTQGPIWTHPSAGPPYRLSVAGSRVAFGDKFGMLQVLDADTGVLVRPAERVSEGPLMGLALTDDGRTAATVGWDMRLRVVDVATMRVLGETRHSEPMYSVWWSGDERLLISNAEGEVQVRELDRLELSEVHYATLSGLAQDPDRTRSGQEWAAVARALSFHQQYAAAAEASQRAEGLTALERGRIAWQAGDGDAAVAQFERARSEGLASDAYLALCIAAASASAAAHP